MHTQRSRRLCMVRTPISQVGKAGSSPAASTKHTMGYKDPDKQKAYLAKHYQDNKPIYLRRSKHTRTLLREWIRAQLAGLVCVNCGERDHAALDLHHLNPEQKEFTISSIATWTTDKKRISAEIAKCVCLCANCHRKHHAGRLGLELTEEHLIKIDK